MEKEANNKKKKFIYKPTYAYTSEFYIRVYICCFVLNNTKMNMHKLIPIQYIELLLYDTRNIMNKYLIAKDIQNDILNSILINQNYYLDNFNRL